MNDFVEAEFKGNRREFCSNSEEYPLKINDYIILQVDKGIDLGCVYRIYNLLPPDIILEAPLYPIIRKASLEDLTKLALNRQKEELAKPIAKTLIKKHLLAMKLSDVEYQLDANKITFYFTADERVDFRELVKDLAQQFKARIELRQINTREEARKIGGCGKCGLPLCCTTCLVKDFKPISTQHAKDQLLSTNPTKLTGMCGRLRCCLRYELPMYQDELKQYPELEAIIKTPAGEAVVDKIDIFSKSVYLRYKDDIIEALPLKDVQQFLLNQ